MSVEINSRHLPKNEIDAVALQIDPYFLRYPSRNSNSRKRRYEATRKDAARIIARLDRFRADHDPQSVENLTRQLKRANALIGWMVPYIGSMCPPTNGLFDLNEHCMENHIPEPGKETKGSPLRQRREGVR